jgi:hypothetical protein
MRDVENAAAVDKKIDAANYNCFSRHRANSSQQNQKK